MKRWYEISKYPMSPEVQNYREQKLSAARSKNLIDSRIDYLRDLVADKDVLDIGVVAHDADFADDSNWLHKYLYQSAKNVLGVDILEDEVDKLRSKGFNVICNDLIKEPLNLKFDVIICGEVLEHLDAPGYLLANCAKMLNSGGRVIITVPNPWYIGFMIKNIFKGKSFQDNADHVSWFDACTLCELGERHGLAIDSFKGIKHKEHNQKFLLLKRIFFGITALLIFLGLRSELFAKTMLYEFILEDNLN